MISKLKPKSEFVHHVLTLMTGTTIAQAIPIVISPILTRIYTPEDFGILAIYTSMVGILSAAATGRYELAVMLPEKESDANALVILSLIIAAILGLITLFLLWLFYEKITILLGNSQIGLWLYLVPVSTFLSGSYNALNYWLNRQKRYTIMSQNRILQSSLTSITSICLGWLHGGFSGLIAGTFIGQSVTTLMLVRQFIRQRKPRVMETILVDCKRVFIAYKNHPLHLLPAQWIGAAALQIPVLLISNLFGVIVTGFYSMALRMISVPTLLIATAIGDVYRQRASEIYRKNGQFQLLFIKTLLKTLKFAIIPFTVIFITAPELFAFVFGNPWRIAGEYARILSVAAFFQFFLTPIDKGALIVGATWYIFLWHLARLVSLVVLAVIAYISKMSIDRVLIFIVCINVLLYSTDGILNYYRFSRGQLVGKVIR